MYRLSLTILTLYLFLFTGCEKKTSPISSPTLKQPMVIVSSPPYAYLTQLIAGDTVQIECLIPSGTNPHLFELPPKQVQKVLQAALWLRLGEPMESKFLDIFRSHNPHMQIIDLSNGIAMIDHTHSPNDTCCSHDGQDRHFWTSPKIAQQQLKMIAEGLTTLYPYNAALYRNNLDLGLEQLSQLDLEIRTLFATTRPHTIAISHPALGYFCREYGIEQLSIEIEGKEPLPGDLAILVAQIQEKNITTILLLPQHNNQGALRIAELMNLKIVMIDPYAIDYPAAMQSTAAAIANSHPASS